MIAYDVDCWYDDCTTDNDHDTDGEDDQDKTQCQLCKKLAWPIINHSWSSLVWKMVSPLD